MHTELSYVKLDPRLSTACQPTPVKQPQWLAFNSELAALLQLPETLCATELGAQVFAGNSTPDWAQPHALAYAGHQFAHFVPQLGDGRALLLTEVIAADGERYDLQLKGAGRTPYSRGGDGRAPIGPVLREYLVSEAMHTLGVPTTRALAAVATSEWVQRDPAQPGAVLTRVSKSHLRVGTAQYVLALREKNLLKAFADYVIQRHYPSCADQDAPYLALLKAVIDQQAQLIAQWMSLGFIHGVMNTDNMTLSGETIDYGPCAFMEAYDPATVFSAIDQRGRYMFQNQPPIAMWNLARYAETLLPLFDADEATAIEQATQAVTEFESSYQHYYWQRMTAKLGLNDSVENRQLAQDYLDLMQQRGVDFTLAFRYLGDADSERLAVLFEQHEDWQKWYQKWQQALPSLAARSQLKLVNPAYIPRNHLVEAMIQEVLETGALTRFNRLHDALKKPYHEREELADLMRPASAQEQVKQTFCGT
ncbi:protein adenylyltransferase SelO [Pseudidiomarina sediminum]|uniref:protein adenylyltransferase SelO n=1 Tax=Pseudidiomarina sediminum TaxID=431675 RepID=UPI001C96DCCB|nr:YdiU family protein [Pseudidiomarina sediminum]MBY6062888.1 YdiU family protein [Pseudidiomarina sediminum]